MNSLRTLVTLGLAIVMSAGLSVASASAQDEAAAPPPSKVKASPLEVYVHTLTYRDAHLAAGAVGHRLSPRGTVEVQPGSNTLAVRDIASVLINVKRILQEFDRPPASIRLELRVVQAGPRVAVSPPGPPAGQALPPALLARLKSLLLYDSYHVLAQAAMTSQEGESVDYSLGPDYSVSFKVSSVQPQGQVRMKDFRIVERLSSDKGRGVEPKELFRADLNVRLDRPFTLVLTRDEERKEALLVALTGRLEPSRPAKPDGR